ncbi:MAG: hypothetical protein ACI4JX_01645, partial [Oscillospiraceae bacterium]
SMVYEVKEQQAYYTAKSAVDSVASYLNANGVADNGDNTLSTKLAKLDWSKCTDPTAANPWEKDEATGGYKYWADGDYVKGEWSDEYDKIGKYKVDIFPTAAKNKFKVVAEAEFDGHKGYSAGIISPYSSGTGLEDALVSTGSVSLNGSPHWQGGVSANQTELNMDSSPFLGGSIVNTGSINTQYVQNGMGTNHFKAVMSSGNVLRFIAGTNLTVGGGAYCSFGEDYVDPSAENYTNKKTNVLNFYSYLVSGGDLKITGWQKNGDETIRLAEEANASDKGIYCGGNMVIDNTKFGEIHCPVYVKGNLEIKMSSDGKFVFKGPVYVCGSVSFTGGMSECYFEQGIEIGGTMSGTTLVSNTLTGVTQNNAATPTATYEDQTEKMDDRLEELLRDSSNATKYGDWTFTAEQYNLMGGSGTANAAKNYGVINIEDHSGHIYQNEVVNESGSIEGFTSSCSNSGGGGVVFDTNIYTVEPIYDATTGQKVSPGVPSGDYQDLYIKITKSVQKDDLGKAVFSTLGRGNVYIYLPTNVHWESYEVGFYSKDFIDEAHIYIISNSGCNMNFGSFNGTKTREGTFARTSATGGQATAYFYAYNPKGMVSITGSSGFAGSVIAKDPHIDSGSNLTNLFVPPVDKNGNPMAMNGIGGSVGYSVEYRSKK